jgi:hypothetical protein
MPTIMPSSIGAPPRLGNDGMVSAAAIVRATGPGARAAKWMPLVCGAATLAVPWAFFTALFLYEFYVKGSFLQDAGWFAFLMSEGGLSLRDPLALGAHSFLGTHISPIFLASGLLRDALPVSDTQFFCGAMALFHALPAVAVFWALRAGVGLRAPAASVLAAVVAIAFAFNGLALAIALYPHFEILVAASIMLFAVALVERRLPAAAVFLAVALATREDAGCHLFAILAVLIALNRWYGAAWRTQRPELTFAALALLYSAAAIVVQPMFATAPSAMVRIYLGSPAFSGLSLGLVGERLLGWFAYRTYVILPGLIALMWAVRTRNPYLLVGYIAYLPWGMLQLIANSDMAGTLTGYYAYPYLIAAFWPVVGATLGGSQGDSRSGATMTIIAFSTMIATSFVGTELRGNPGNYELRTGFFASPSWSLQTRTEQAMTSLVHSKAGLGPILVDGSVTALAPDAFAWNETILGSTGGARPMTVVYFSEGYESLKARHIATAAGLNRIYQIPGTALRIATDHPLAPSLPVAAIAVPVDPPK